MWSALLRIFAFYAIFVFLNFTFFGWFEENGLQNFFRMNYKILEVQNSKKKL